MIGTSHVFHTINGDFHSLRHSLCLDPEFLKGKRVLDLGSCVGATGAWVLHHGAEKYVGVEIQKHFADLSKDNLSKYFDNPRWEIITSSFDDFFENNIEQFDIVIALEVIYTVPSVEIFLKCISDLGAELIVIDTLEHPDFKDVPITKHGYLGTVTGTVDSPEHYIVESSGISRPGLRAVMNRFNYKLDKDLTSRLNMFYPGEYRVRYCVTLVPGRELKSLPFLEEVAGTDQGKLPYTQKPAGIRMAQDHWSLNKPSFFNAEYFENLILDQCNLRSDNVVEMVALVMYSGQGTMIKKLSEKNWHHLTGYDQDENNIRLSKACFPNFFFTNSLLEAARIKPFDTIIVVQETIENILDLINTVKDLLSDKGFVIISTRTAMSNNNSEIYDRLSGTTVAYELKSFEQIKQHCASIGLDKCELLDRTMCFDTFVIQKY